MSMGFLGSSVKGPDRATARTQNTNRISESDHRRVTAQTNCPPKRASPFRMRVGDGCRDWGF